MTDLFVGMDIGGTKLVAGAATADGKLVGEATTPTPQRLRPQEVVDGLIDLANLAIRKAGAIWKEVRAVGVSFGGPVDFGRELTITCHHLPGWSRVPLTKVVKTKLQLPVIMDNNANTAALGESRFGAGQGIENLLYVTVGSGIGAGLILGGKVFRGASGLAGELGHTIFRPSGPVCACGRKGCIEAMASGKAIAHIAKTRLAECKDASILRHGDAKGLDARAVAQAAEKGDKLALTVILEATDALGQGIAAALNLLDLPLVLIGGGVANAGEVFFSPLREAVKRYAVPEIADEAKILPAQLGDRASLLGAIAMAVDYKDEG
jgi:glucokinase